MKPLREIPFFLARVAARVAFTVWKAGDAAAQSYSIRMQTADGRSAITVP